MINRSENEEVTSNSKPSIQKGDQLMSDLSKDTLYFHIREILTSARQHICTTVNSTMVQTYWHIGQLIVEDEQKGEKRAEYGKQQLKQLSVKLSMEFGKGFDSSNLRYMRLFYQAFPICDALRHELSWTHYRILSRIVGYEIPFNRHFYQYVPPRSLEEIDTELDAVTKDIMKLLAEVHS